MATKITKVLVTGSKGFIGSHLMKALGDRGVHYDIHKSSAFDINRADTLKAVILANKPKVIVHLAAKSNIQDVNKDPELALKTNIIGTFNVLRLAHKYKIRVIVASSAATAKPELSIYGTSKDCVEKLAGMFDNAVIARFYNVYGSRSKSVVNKFIKQMKERKMITVNGNTYRDYIHVDDIVKSLISLIDAEKPPKLVEIGTGRAVSLQKLIQIIKKELGMHVVAVHQNVSLKEIQHSQCKDRYGRYTITLEQGVRRLINGKN